MHRLYELKERLIDELIEHADKELTRESLDTIDTLAHAAKNLCKVIDAADKGESYRGYYRGGSYARGRGRSARRDSMGRYASEGMPGASYEDGYSRAESDLAEKLQHKISSAPDERTRRILQDIMDEM